MANLILAHDFGTTSDKACLFDAEGSFLAEATCDYPIYYPHPGWAEQNPEDWWTAVKAASQAVMEKSNALPKDVKAVSFSAQGMAVIPVDRQGIPLTERSMIWMDTRPKKEGEYILKEFGARRHYERTGNGFDIAMYPAAKILWLKKHMPEIYQKTYKFLGCKEYLIHKMTGVIGKTDYTESGLGGFYDLHNRRFDPELLALSETDEEKLLEPVDVTAVIGGLTSKAAAEMGLAADTPVVIGSWDNFACSTGAGARTKGNMAVYLGTAGWLSITHSEPMLAQDCMVNNVYVGQDTYFPIFNTNAACAAFDWVMDYFCGSLGRDFKKAEELAAGVPAGSEGMFYLPALYAGNSFYSDANLCGTYLGITPQSTDAHVIRAAMEGVGFDLMMGAEFFRGRGALPWQANIIGGGANSEVWMDILASMFGICLSAPKNRRHIGALGAALNGMVGTGMIRDFDVAGGMITPQRTAHPNAADREAYLHLLPAFREFYEALTPAYAKRMEVLTHEID